MSNPVLKLARISAGLVAIAISLALLMPSTRKTPKALNPEFNDKLTELQFEIEVQEALQRQEEHRQKTAEQQRKLQDQVKQSLPPPQPPEPKSVPAPQPELPPAEPAPQAVPAHRHRGLFFRSRHLMAEEDRLLP